MAQSMEKLLVGTTMKSLMDKRKETLALMETHINKINNLEILNPTKSHVRRFTLYNDEASELLRTLKIDNKKFVGKLIEGGLSTEDKDYVADQKKVNQAESHLFDALDDYSATLREKGLLQDPDAGAAAPPPGDLIQVMLKHIEASEANSKMALEKYTAALFKCTKQQSEAQTAVIKQQSEAQASAMDKLTEGMKDISKSNINIRRPKPNFTPDGTIDDYFRYREWYRKFEFYTAKIDEDDYSERLEWLRNCLHGDALTLIQSCADTQDGYETAIKLLEDKYKDKDVIQEALFDYFHKFTIPSNGKNYKGLTDKLTQYRNYKYELEIELETPFDPKRYLGHVILKSMTPEVKKEFMITCETLTPTDEQILEKADEVVRKMNVYSGLTPTYPDLTKKSSNNSNSNNANISSQNQITNPANSNANKGKKSRKKSKSAAVNALSSGTPPVVTPPIVSPSVATPPAKTPSGGSSQGKSNYKQYGQPYAIKCRFCKSPNHSSKLCGKYQTVQERLNILNTQNNKYGDKLCKICCFSDCDGKESSHKVNGLCDFTACVAKNKGKHAKVLCDDLIQANTTKLCQNAFIVATNSQQNSPTVPSKYDPVDPETLTYSIGVSGRKARTTALETALLLAQNEDAKHLPPHDRHIAIMTDTCSQRSVIAKNMVDKYKFPIIGVESVALQGFNERHPKCRNYKVVRVVLGKDGKRPIILDALIVNDVNSIHMVGAAAFAKKVAERHNLADFRYLSTKSDLVSVDLLVGAEHRWKIVSPLKRPIQVRGMWCPRTVFGDLMLTGSIPGASGVIPVSQAATNLVTLLNVNVLPPLQVLENDEYILEPNMWDVAHELTNFDNLGITITSKQDQDREALENFNSTVSKDPNSNAFVVGFPWTGNSPPNKNDLDSNLDIVKSRFMSTMKTLDNNPDKLQEYAKVHQSEVDKNFIERVPDEELCNDEIFKHFITHFPVFKEDEGCTTKVRRVFDASLHKRGKASLNDLMAKGSQLTPHILKVLLILRLFPFLLTADISKAFLRMQLLPRDRNYTCFLARKNWEDPNSPIEVWRFKSVLFGATSSPFLLNCSIADILSQNDFDEAMEVFVDNLFVLLEEEEGILNAAEQLCDVFLSNAMPLHELASNSTEANLKFKSDGTATDNLVLKTLGLFWDFSKDTWTINKPTFTVETASKRSLLSDLARIFDPLGFLAILTIRGKVILQEAWDGVFTWDGKLPPELQAPWTDIVSRIKLALDVPVPRWLGVSMKGPVTLHCFTDASDRAMGCVIYLVQGKNSMFYTAKAKVCPRREMHYTIPRKELTAVSLGIRYIQFVCNSIKKYCIPSSIHLWCDATTALNWCLAKQSHKELFIRARVEHLAVVVRKFGVVYHYITSETNPSDLLTKDSNVNPDHPFWVHGPEILLYPERWTPFQETRAHKDMVPIFCGTTVVKDPTTFYAGLPHPEDFNSLNDLHQETATSMSKEIKQAELLWILKVQQFHFDEVISFLQALDGKFLRSKPGKEILRREKLVPPNICLNLHLFLDKYGIIRVHTSVKNFKGLTFEQINPILMPTEDPYTFLIAKTSHIIVGHMGLKATIRNMRNKYWVVKYTKVVRKVIINCQTCITQRGKRYHVPASPELPEFRFDLDVPFATTCVDMTGFFLCKDKDQNERKAYILLFVCMSTGCGHVEVVESASAESFAEAVERFMAFRGVPIRFFSDNGSNFRGYFPELKKLSDLITRKDNLVQQGIEWKWTPSLAPHFNGFCERSIGLIKGIIKRSVGRKVLTFSQLRTVCAYAQAVFNERPLHVLANTDPDYVPITPHMLVFGRNLRMLSHDIMELNLQDPDYRKNKDISVMALKLRDTLASVRKHWKKDYFHFLTAKDEQRNKSSPHTKSNIIPQINHYVLIKDDNAQDLRIGRIKEIIPSSDGEVRQALVSTSHGESIFPVFKLRFLEGYRSEEIVCAPEEVPKNEAHVRDKLSRLAKDQANSKIKELAQINNVRLGELFHNGA